MTTEQKLTKAKTTLVLDQPFFGFLLMSKLQFVKRDEIPTMATDGRKVYYNSAFVDSLPMKQLVGVLAHEVMHLALCHHTRRNAREMTKWNVACDFAINPLLKTSGFELPSGILDDPKFKDKYSEEIYSMLPPSMKFPSNGIGEVMDATNEAGGRASSADRALQEADWKVATAQAALIAKQRGKLPGDLERFIEEIMEPVVDWREKLKNFVMETLMADYSWSRPNRRFIWQNIYLPSTIREGMGEIVVWVDTSGSIDNEMLSKFAAEIRAIAHECKPSALYVVYIDAAVARVDTFHPADGDEIEIRPAGGGGTDFAPGFEWVEKQGIKPVCGIYLTDLCGSFPDEHPTYPVLWVTDSRQVAPFGETVRVW